MLFQCDVSDGYDDENDDDDGMVTMMMRMRMMIHDCFYFSSDFFSLLSLPLLSSSSSPLTLSAMIHSLLLVLSSLLASIQHAPVLFLCGLLLLLVWHPSLRLSYWDLPVIGVHHPVDSHFLRDILYRPIDDPKHCTGHNELDESRCIKSV